MLPTWLESKWILQLGVNHILWVIPSINNTCSNPVPHINESSHKSQNLVMNWHNSLYAHLRVPDQNGISWLYNMLEIYHSGLISSNNKTTYIQFCFGLNETLSVMGIHKEHNTIHCWEVVFPHSPGWKISKPQSNLKHASSQKAMLQLKMRMFNSAHFALLFGTSTDPN